jgi:hypothetical protein
MKITEVIFDVLTQTETTIEREQTAEEAKAALDFANNFAAEQAKAEAKTAEKAAIFERLGLTEDEARLLLGGN